MPGGLCFPLYACSREIIKRYTPFLEKIDLTYTQYIAMMVLWEKKQISVKELGKCLFLDSGTLTPLLKKIRAERICDTYPKRRRRAGINCRHYAKGRRLKRRSGADSAENDGMRGTSAGKSCTVVYASVWTVKYTRKIEKPIKKGREAVLLQLFPSVIVQEFLL